MKTKTFPLLILLLASAFVSCNKATPAGFWKNYKKTFLEKSISDQGPYGGHRAIYWKAEKAGTFDSKNIIEFADKNGWTLVDSLEFNRDQTSRWTFNNQPIFPLTFKGFLDTISNDNIVEDFPRWFGGQLKLYKFKTGWVTIQPGTDNSIEVNGFVLINIDATKIAVYHLWGD